MTRSLQAANTVATVVLVALVAGALATRNPVGWLLALHLAAAVLALRAARAGAGINARGWAIGTNAWSVILDALSLVLIVYGAVSGLAPVTAKFIVVAAVLALLPVLCALNVRALVGPRAGDA